MQNYMKELKVLENFLIAGEVRSVSPCGEGHINSTFLVKTDKKKYILQKINTVVFKKPEEVMHNILLVTEFLKSQGARTLNFLKTKDGEYIKKYEDEYYRVYDFVEEYVTLQMTDSEEIFENVGYAFGEFQKQLSDFDAGKLYETIEKFHDTPKRFKDLKQAVEDNKSGRLENCIEEVNFAFERENTYGKIVEGLEDKSIPLRVVHNDTKLNNVLVDPKTKKGKVIIDLDTVMPGSMLFDFGDAIRFGASTAAEDEKDLSKVHLNIELFKAYTRGYCDALGESMTKKEKELLPYSAYLISMELGMRFLKDYLDGDLYFTAKYPEQNLVRTRTQFKLASEIQKHMAEMDKIVEDILK